VASLSALACRPRRLQISYMRSHSRTLKDQLACETCGCSRAAYPVVIAVHLRVRGSILTDRYEEPITVPFSVCDGPREMLPGFLSRLCHPRVEGLPASVLVTPLGQHHYSGKVPWVHSQRAADFPTPARTAESLRSNSLVPAGLLLIF
jgi:hypothetical protein